MNVYNTCRNYISYANFSLFIQMKAMKSRSILEKVKCILTSYFSCLQKKSKRHTVCKDFKENPSEKCYVLFNTDLCYCI